jgi:hypothetical protein
MQGRQVGSSRLRLAQDYGRLYGRQTSSDLVMKVPMGDSAAARGV